mmetsp:Transcript_9641/g.14123  ORF Transcript_9641/g.14123 Transcript_9641/m.14123 type:complete len:120 (-) Transcript_9641:11-370(-)
MDFHRSTNFIKNKISSAVIVGMTENPTTTMGMVQVEETIMATTTAMETMVEDTTIMVSTATVMDMAEDTATVTTTITVPETDMAEDTVTPTPDRNLPVEYRDFLIQIAIMPNLLKTLKA